MEIRNYNIKQSKSGYVYKMNSIFMTLYTLVVWVAYLYVYITDNALFVLAFTGLVGIIIYVVTNKLLE